jgi:hypothetical protein
MFPLIKDSFASSIKLAKLAKFTFFDIALRFLLFNY